MQNNETNNISRKGSGKRALLIVVVVILSLILAFLLAVIIGVNAFLNQVQRPDDMPDTMPPEELESILNQEDEVPSDFTGPILSAEDVTIPPAEVQVEDADDVFSILLLGVDNNSRQYRSRTDAMILCTVNVTQKTLTMTSFMRDTYVYIPEFYNQRLNVAYPVGGFETLYDTLEYNFGVSVNKGVAVNFTSFKEVIDAVGGVEIELTGSEAGHLNKNNGWWLQTGVNRLTGEQALAYSRIRALDNDYYRTNRQRKVLSALVQQAKKLSAAEMYKVVNMLIPMVTTDMSNDEILNAAIRVVPIIKDLTIVTHRIPIDEGHTLAMVDGMSVLIPDLEKNRQYLVDILGDLPETEE